MGLAIVGISIFLLVGIIYMNHQLIPSSNLFSPNSPEFILMAFTLTLAISIIPVSLAIIRRFNLHNNFLSIHSARRVPTPEIVKGKQPRAIYNDMGPPVIQVKWYENGYLNRMRTFVIVDIFFLVIIVVVMYYYSRTLGHMDFLLLMLQLLALFCLPLLLLPILINFLAWTPARVGICAEGVYFEYSREIRIYHPLKSVRWKNVDRTFYYEPLKTSTYTFVIGDKLKQVWIDRFLHKPLQEEFEKAKGVDKTRDVSKNDNLITH